MLYRKNEGVPTTFRRSIPDQRLEIHLFFGALQIESRRTRIQARPIFQIFRNSHYLRIVRTFFCFFLT
ncbi:hypothetical protein LEP1GSC071_1886 [Leptospira santarosai str. JET]|nr:hypothetical protein LEP1GSC071_1886 [Leptospira santarosai str. JET]